MDPATSRWPTASAVTIQPPATPEIGLYKLSPGPQVALDPSVLPGLLVLAAQSELPVPAAQSGLPVLAAQRARTVCQALPELRA